MLKQSYTQEIKEQLTKDIANAIVKNRNSSVDSAITQIFYKKSSEMFPNISVFQQSHTTGIFDASILANIYRGKKDGLSIKSIASTVTDALVDVVDESVDILNRIIKKD